MNYNLESFNKFIEGCNTVLNITEWDLLEQYPTQPKGFWEENSFFANGEMKKAHIQFHKKGGTITANAYDSRNHIEHLVYRNGNSYSVLIDKKLKKLKKRFEDFRINHNMNNYEIMYKNQWFFELYGLFQDFEDWFYDLTKDSITNKPQQETKEDTPTKKAATQNLWFKIGLLFATGEMNKLLEEHNRNTTQIAKALKDTSYRPYISETLSNTNTNDKNIYSSSKKMQEIIKHCENEKIDITADFVNQYNLIKDK